MSPSRRRFGAVTPRQSGARLGIPSHLPLPSISRSPLSPALHHRPRTPSLWLPTAALRLWGAINGALPPPRCRAPHACFTLVPRCGRARCLAATASGGSPPSQLVPPRCLACPPRCAPSPCAAWYPAPFPRGMAVRPVVLARYAAPPPVGAPHPPDALTDTPWGYTIQA